MIKCNGKCAECQAFLNGEIENSESCAIWTTQRRTFDMNQRLTNIELLISKFIEEFTEKKGKKSIPVKSSDNINQIKFDENEVSDLQ